MKQNKIRVWAPKAEKAECVLNGETYLMENQKDGWKQLEIEKLEHGVDYGFKLDGSKILPDPRSAWQPYGVHGLSRIVDHTLFQWNDENWRQPSFGSAVVYELHIGTFTEKGTFEAVIEKIGYLKDLGITHIEIMPVNEFPGSRGWGYDGVGLFAPFHHYGGPEMFKKLINACHQEGLAVILDVVYNHLGPSGNYLGQFGPYFTGKYSTPWGEAVNLDGTESGEVRRFFIDNALMWLRDYHIDGLRIDAVHAFVDISAVHFLEQLSFEVRNLETETGKTYMLIAESDLNDPRIIRSPELGGYGIDAQWNEDFHHALHTVMTGEQNGYYTDFGKISHLVSVIQSNFFYDGKYSEYRQRVHGRSAEDISGKCFTVYLQNHDQIGNRAVGDRISSHLSPAQLKIGAAIVMFSPFVPMLFQGEEWGASTPFLFFTDHQEPELAEAVRKGRREEFAAFGWDPENIPDPQAEETFRKSCLRWQEKNQVPHEDLLEWYKNLIRLRRSHPQFRTGSRRLIAIDYDEERRWLKIAKNGLLLICNFSGENNEMTLEEDIRPLMFSEKMSGIEYIRENQIIIMPAHSVLIAEY